MIPGSWLCFLSCGVILVGPRVMGTFGDVIGLAMNSPAGARSAAVTCGSGRRDELNVVMEGGGKREREEESRLYCVVVECWNDNVNV